VLTLGDDPFNPPVGLVECAQGIELFHPLSLAFSSA
jgi:hypothetical protein